MEKLSDIINVTFQIDRKKVELIGIEKVRNTCKVAVELEYINTVYDKEIESHIAFLDKENGF
jgi:chemotaxis protein CheY-P-specific phosphatase CheC